MLSMAFRLREFRKCVLRQNNIRFIEGQVRQKKIRCAEIEELDRQCHRSKGCFELVELISAGFAALLRIEENQDG